MRPYAKPWATDPQRWLLLALLLSTALHGLLWWRLTSLPKLQRPARMSAVASATASATKSAPRTLTPGPGRLVIRWIDPPVVQANATAVRPASVDAAVASPPATRPQRSDRPAASGRLTPAAPEPGPALAAEGRTATATTPTVPTDTPPAGPSSPRKALNLDGPAGDRMGSDRSAAGTGRTVAQDLAAQQRMANRPSTPGERMAAALGADDRLRDEIRGAGRVRLRQGRGCIDLRESRAAQINPINSQGTGSGPWLGEPCE